MGTWARNNTWKYIKCGKEADDLPATPPSGKKTIDSTAEVDVSAYATAQVVDANLTAENIKKDVAILGTTGSYEGSGSSDFSTAEVTVVVEENTNEYVFYGAITEEAEGDYPAESLPFNNISESPYVFNVILYKGQAWGQIAINGVQVTPWEISATGDIETSGNGFDITGDGTITITAST